MNPNIILGNIVLSMRDYQKKNNIKKQCITNTQYLYDIIKINSNMNVKTKAVFVLAHNEEKTTTFVGGHLVLVLGDEDEEIIIDPSYDIFCLKNKLYFDNLNDLLNINDGKDKNKLKSMIDIKFYLCKHIDMMKISDQINNGELIITEKEHYNKQADYIDKLYDSK